MYGLSFQYSHEDARTGNNSHTSWKTDTARFGAYATRWRRNHYFKINGQAALAHNSEKNYYSYFDEYSRGSFNSVALGTSFETGLALGYGRKCSPGIFSPHLGFNFYYVTTEPFSERGGSLARRFDRQNYIVGELPFGLRMSKTILMFEDYVSWVRPTLDISYVRSICDATPTSQVWFAQNQNIGWKAQGATLGRDALRLNVGLSSCLTNGININFEYGLETRANYLSQQFFASLTKAW